LPSRSVILRSCRSWDRLSGVDSESLLREGSQVVSNRRSDDRVVVNSISVDSASSEGVADLVAQVRDKYSDEISVLVNLSRASINVREHLSEGIVHKEHLSLVKFVLLSHIIDELSLVIGPGILIVVGNLREKFSSVGVVEAIPGVVISEHISHLDFIQ
jgi:hypothetical protein